MNQLALQPLSHSRPALALVVFMHVIAALLIVQVFEARRYVEPMPLMVSLLPSVQQVHPAPKSLEPQREVKRMGEPDPVVAPNPIALSVPVPVPVAVRREPVQVEHSVREPVSAPMPQPVQKVADPAPVKVVAPEPAPAPDPVPSAIAEVPPPDPQAQPVPSAPAIVAAPEPRPITVPEQPRLAAVEPEEVTMTSQMLAAVYLRNPKPSYPNLSRRLNEQGTVLLRVFVTSAGNATTVELKQSSGFARLDRAAQEAVQDWKFVPAKRGEQPVDAWVVVPIKFSLKG
jgi:protein TonB